jgi:hypothetical protein
MSNPFKDESRKDHGDKLERMVGKRGEYPPDRAVRIAAVPAGKGQGDSAREPEEVFVGAPARQVSNYGTVRK